MAEGLRGHGGDAQAVWPRGAEQGPGGMADHEAGRAALAAAEGGQLHGGGVGVWLLEEAADGAEEE